MSEVASIFERSITVTLGELTVVNNDGGYDEVTSRTTVKKADIKSDVAGHSSTLETAVARSVILEQKRLTTP